MPKGSNGQKRPADAIGRAIMATKFATGDAERIEARRSRSGKRGPYKKRSA